MERISIRKDSEQGYAFYSFKPQGFIEGFFARSATVLGIGFDKPAGRWTAPARPETLETLEAAFGQGCLVWDDKKFPPQHLSLRRAATKSPVPATKDRGTVAVRAAELPKHWQLALHRTEEQLKVKRYSWRTVKSYLSHLRSFFAAHTNLALDEIDNGVIRTYIVGRTDRGNYAESTQNQMLNAVKFWLEQVEGRDKCFIELRAKKREQLPTVLSVEEVRRLFSAIENIKHRCILKIIYGGGLRLSEVTSLRIADINSDRLQVFVHGGKGKKDRYTTLSKSFLVELRAYFVAYRPSFWLFEGQTGGKYSVRSVQVILRKAVERSGVNPFCTVHTLRHSYATHLLEAGTSLRHIQELLGHANSTTTEIYTHVSTAEKQRVISPLDRI